MKRYASEDEPKKSDVPFELAPLQEEKLLNFFKYYLDGDCDGFVFEHDFHQFAEVGSPERGTGFVFWLIRYLLEGDYGRYNAGVVII